VHGDQKMCEHGGLLISINGKAMAARWVWLAEHVLVGRDHMMRQTFKKNDGLLLPSRG